MNAAKLCPRFTMELPEGYGTRVESGVHLGGQRQRIATRAVCKDLICL